MCRASCCRSLLSRDALTALGVVVTMVEVEADDALASAAWLAAKDPRVERVVICTPDKDLAQSVVGTRVVQLNRRTKEVFDEAGVMKKFGVAPASIPDYLALVGDSADGYPGLAGWGAKSSSAVLAKFGHIENIPADWRDWHANATNASRLAQTLADQRDLALLFRRLATLRSDVPVFKKVDELRWTGPTPAFEAMATRLEGTTTRTKRGSGTRASVSKIGTRRRV